MVKLIVIAEYELADTGAPMSTAELKQEVQNDVGFTGMVVIDVKPLGEPGLTVVDLGKDSR
jgi:hypothetical protein